MLDLFKKGELNEMSINNKLENQVIYIFKNIKIFRLKN